jgi:hypothetical protein
VIVGQLLLIAAAAVLMIGGAVLVNRLTSRPGTAARRALMQVPETAIAAVKDGATVRLRGRAVARAPLRTAPLSGLPCIGFRLTVEIWRGDDEGMQQVFAQQELDSFALRDETGEAVLQAPFKVDIEPHQAGSQPLPPALSRILAREDVPETDLLGFDNSFVYAEAILQPGDEIIAVGRATLEVDPGGRAPSYRDPPCVCHLKGVDEPVAIASADDGEGES